MKIFEKVYKGENLKKVNNENLNNNIWKKIVQKK